MEEVNNIETRQQDNMETQSFEKIPDFDPSSSDDDEDDVVLKPFKKPKGKKKVGRKAAWDEQIVNDLVDIITDDEKLKTKLLFTNVKNVKNSQYYEQAISELKVRCEERGTTFNYSITQTRDKFKRCVSLCKDATLKAKTASGITRFQEDKDLGDWFKVLQPIVATMDSAQPEQSIEPSSGRNSTDTTGGSALNNLSDSADPPEAEAEEVRNDNVRGRKRDYVPVRDGAAKSKKSKTTELLQATLKSVNELMANDPTPQLIRMMDEENKRQERRDAQMFALFSAALLPRNHEMNHYADLQHSELSTQHSARPTMNQTSSSTLSSPPNQYNPAPTYHDTSSSSSPTTPNQSLNNESYSRQVLLNEAYSPPQQRAARNHSLHNILQTSSQQSSRFETDASSETYRYGMSNVNVRDKENMSPVLYRNL